MHVDRWLKQSTQTAAIFVCGLSVALVLFCILYPMKPKEASIPGEMAQKAGRFLFPYEAIGSGGLALHPRHALGWVSRLADELVLIAYNSRPDVDTKESKVLIAMKNGKEQLAVANGRTIYLKESEQGKGLLPSQEATGLWAKPILLENGAVLIEAGRKLVSKDGGVGEEKGQFIVAGQGAPSRYSPAGQPFARELKFARAFSHDLLLQKYGGREYRSWCEKSVLELESDHATYACFVSAGDYLLHDKGEWRVCAFEDLKVEHPVARVKAISGKTIEIEAWDETGYCPLQFKIEMEKQGGRPPVKPEAMPASIRLRSGTQVSCALGKRRVILRQGDWLLKTAGGWRNLRRSEEIEQYLHHRLKGELFIFDLIEKEQGRTVMKGHLFDETRTQMQPISLSIETESNHQGKASRKRRPIFDRRAA
jgi:hypothetical protein